MPELPEVEIVKRGLEPVFARAPIARLELKRKDLRAPIPPALPKKLAGRPIQTLMRRGKYILGFTPGGPGFVLHLGMSGTIRIYGPQDPPEARPHDHVIWHMQDGGRIVLNDPRRFGSLGLVHEENWQSVAPFHAMGPEPLGNGFNGKVLAAQLLGRISPIKIALLDQNIVAGVGNIYACEALYRAGINPARPAASVQGEEAENLASAIRDVLNAAIKVGGSTLRDYKHTDGKIGYFQHHFAVYDRAGSRCPDCRCDAEKNAAKNTGESRGIQRIIQGGRSTFYCPSRQE